jgi:hypothetical protein
MMYTSRVSHAFVLLPMPLHWVGSNANIGRPAMSAPSHDTHTPSMTTQEASVSALYKHFTSSCLKQNHQMQY